MTDLATSTCVDHRAMPVIEVFADVGCPFTHVGLLKFVERRAAMDRSDVHLWIRPWPLEIVNGKPLDPRVVGEEVAEAQRTVAPGLFRGFSPLSFPQHVDPGTDTHCRARTRSTPRPVNASRSRCAGRSSSTDSTSLTHLRSRRSPLDTGSPTSRLPSLSCAPSITPGSPAASSDHRTSSRPTATTSPPGLDVSHDPGGRVRLAPSGARFDDFMDAALA